MCTPGLDPQGGLFSADLLSALADEEPRKEKADRRPTSLDVLDYLRDSWPVWACVLAAGAMCYSVAVALL
jgi:hypothetical protein